MENVFENFKFIADMDEELDDLVYEIFIELNQKIYESLLENYPSYRDIIHECTELSDILFKDALAGTDQYNNARAKIERPINIANFLLGIKLGMKIQA